MKVTIEKNFKTINVEQANGSLVLKSYIAVDTKRKWYLHNNLFAGMYSIHNYETGEFICGLYESGDIGSIGKINIDDFAAIKKLWSQKPVK